MKTHHLTLGSAALFALAGLTGCGSGSSADAEMDAVMASVEAKIPGRDRASVRVCETLLDTTLQTQEDALGFVTAGLEELQASSDPNGMKNALMMALVKMGDALVAGDSTGYESAAVNMATVCTDIVSGEYGK